MAGITLLALTLAAIGWLWWASRLPTTYSAGAMGAPDFGGGTVFAHAGHTTHAGGQAHAAPPTSTTARSVTEFVAPAGTPADVSVRLEARAGRVTLPFDALDHGTPAPLPFDPTHADRRFTYDIGRLPGFMAGRPGWWWSINGPIVPHVPMYMVREGEVIVMRISNGSGEVHPMHLHGHHLVVLSRNGVASMGSPWWVDSLDVRHGETYEVAPVADNPGIWMDHCHNLPHAAEGLMTHLMYEGVDTPFLMGPASGNEPE